jgi:hypothetical protein
MNKCLIVLLSLSLWSGLHGEVIAKTSSSIEHDLNKLIKEISGAVTTGTNSTKYCSENLANYYKRLFSFRDEHINSSQISDLEIDEIIKNSFRSRLDINEKMKKLEVASKNGEKCLSSIKDVVRALRYVEDYMIEIKYQRLGYLKTMDFVTFTGSGSLFLKNPSFNFSGIQDLKSGDIILSRGSAYSSAAIARIGENDSQFSHLTLVYQDESKILHTIEAHTEIGAVTAPLSIHINQRNARSVVLRHKDSKLAHEAAKYMFNKVNKRQKKNNIRYDFGMDYKSNTTLFCSEVVHDGFKYASKKLYKKEMNIPQYKTKFDPGLITFLQDFGIDVNRSNIASFDTFGPGDIQFDSSFQIVAEWRNPKKIRETRFKDAVLTKIFEWMEKENYKFYPPAGIALKSRFSWLMRRTPFVKKMLEEKFPLNMSAKQLRLFLILDLVGEKLHDRLKETATIAKRTLSPIEMYEALEAFKVNDQKRYDVFIDLSKKARQYRGRTNVPHSVKRKLRETRPVFHRYFHN